MQAPTLDPVAAGQTRFRLQGLTADSRGIAVGREALVVLEGLDRLVGFLGAYSEEASLDELVPTLTVERAVRAGGGQALLVRCAVQDGFHLDRIARLGAAVRATTFTGSGSIYVKTRDRSAPFGWDLAISPAEVGRSSPQTVHAVHGQYSAQYEVRERLDPVDLIQRLELRREPMGHGGIAGDPELCGMRELALGLVAPGLSDRVLTYLWRAEIPFGAVRVQLEEDSHASVLMRLRQPSGRILDVLRSVPGVELFAPVSPRAAVEVGYRHPLRLASANACLPGDEMYLFRGRAGRVERIDGAPRFVDGRHLVRADARTRVGEVGQVRPVDLAPLRVSLELRPTALHREPRASLVPWQQAELLRRLVYVVPPSTLANARILALSEGLLVVSGGLSSRGGALGGASLVPLGSRMVETAPGVLVPDGWELWPRVRPALVRTLLGLEGDDHAIYLAPDRAPLRVRADQLAPLDTSVIGRISMTDAQSVMPDLKPLEPGRIENERLGRFALWGIPQD